MFLGVGPAELVVDDVAHKVPAERVGPERVAVRPGERAEHLGPIGSLVEPVGVVEGVPGFVPQQHHGDLAGFDLTGLLLLDAGQPPVHQVERDADDRHLVRTAPTVGRVDLRVEH